MPLYLVRWPDLSCSLVTAEDPEELHLHLDEIADASSIEFWEYDGPICLDFKLPVDVTIRGGGHAGPAKLPTHEDIELSDVARVAEREYPSAEIPFGDLGSEMVDTMYVMAFPNLHNVHLAHEDAPDPDGLPVQDVTEALRADALMMVRSAWRAANAARSDDPLTQLAVTMGTSPEVIRSLARAAAEAKAESEAPLLELVADPPSTPSTSSPSDPSDPSVLILKPGLAPDSDDCPF